MQRIVRVWLSPSSRKWNWTIKRISQVRYRALSPMQRTNWWQPNSMLPILQTGRAMLDTTWLHWDRSFFVIAIVASRVTPWILTTSYYILICYLKSTPMCWQNGNSVFAMCWWMSIRTRTLRSTVLCGSWPVSISMYVWWVTMHKAFIVFVEQI